MSREGSCYVASCMPSRDAVLSLPLQSKSHLINVGLGLTQSAMPSLSKIQSLPNLEIIA